MNFSAPFIAQFFKQQLDEVLPYVDYVIANESEAAAYAESHDLKTTDVVEIAKEVANYLKENKQIPRTVIFTQGLEPTITVTYDATKDSFDVQQYPVKELAKEKLLTLMVLVMPLLLGLLLHWLKVKIYQNLLMLVNGLLLCLSKKSVHLSHSQNKLTLTKSIPKIYLILLAFKMSFIIGTTVCCLFSSF